MRLTNNHRDHIVNSEKKRKFDELLSKEKEKLSKEVYKYCLKNLVNKKIPQDLIDEGFIRRTDMARVKFFPEKGHEEVRLSEYLPLKVHENWYIDATDKMKEIHSNIARITDEKTKFSRELTIILYSMSTKNQVDAGLPELSHYLKDEKKVMSMSLIPIEQINNMRAMLK